MLDDIRARLRGGLYDPLVAADVSLLLAEIERLAQALVSSRRYVPMLAVCNEVLEYWESDPSGFAECDPGCDCVVDHLRAALAALDEPHA